MRVVIEKMGINGEGIGYINRKPVFVDGVLIKEEADIEVAVNNKTYAIGKVKKIVKTSEHRVKPKCKIQGRCGACPLMITDYKDQCAIKEANLKQALIKYAHVNPKLIKKIIPSENVYNYRNQLKLPFSMNEERQLVTGMYQPNSNYFNEIENCIIHDNELEQTRKAVLKVLNDYRCRSYDYHQKKGFRSLVIRMIDGKSQITLITGEEELPVSMVEAFMQIKGVVSLWQSVNTIKKTPEIFGPKMVLLAGERTLDIGLDDLKIQLSPRSFFQLNTLQAKKLYSTAKDLLKDHYGFIVEAYSGVGGISLYLKDKGDEIIGIESIKDAVVNANANARLNDAKNVSFVCADAADKLTYLSKKRQIDLLVVDPPRSGLDDAMLESILKSKINEILYISCNPATLGKNLDILGSRYAVKVVQPVDMFPNTAHVECVCLMTRTGK